MFHANATQANKERERAREIVVCNSGDGEGY